MDARVVKDMATGKSKGYGFVSFYNKLVCSFQLNVNLIQNLVVNQNLEYS